MLLVAPREAVLCQGCSERISQQQRKPERLVTKRHSFDKVSLVVGEDARGSESPRPQRRIGLVQVTGQPSFEPGTTFAEVAPHEPKHQQGFRNGEASSRLTPLQRPRHRRAEVVKIGVQAVQLRHLLWSVAGRASSFGTLLEDGDVRPANVVRLTAPLELLEGERPNRLQHPEPNLVGRVSATSEQALVNQGGDAPQHVHPGATGRRNYPLGRVQGEASGEDGKAPEQCLLLRRQEVVAPGHRVPHRVLAIGEVARSAGQHLETVGQAREQGRW